MDTTNSSEELQAPYQDVVSFAFDRQKVFDEGKPLYINADDPRQFLNYAQTLRFVRQLIAGLKTGGLEDGDTVLVHLFNNVSSMMHAAYFGKQLILKVHIRASLPSHCRGWRYFLRYQPKPEK